MAAKKSISKRALKKSLVLDQVGVCALSGVTLPIDLGLMDADRIIAKAEGGIYTEDNTRVVEPVAHLARHGNLRTRESALDDLKAVFDDRAQVMRLKLKINNQLLAFQRRTDHPQPKTTAFLVSQLAAIDAELSDRNKQIERALLAYRQFDRLVAVALGVPFIGPMTIAALTVYVDLAKANSASSLWKYAGLHCSSGDRYQKGEASGGNKTLRCALWNSASVMVRGADSPYRDVYDRTKARLSVSENHVMSRNTQGKLVEVAWKDTKPSHRHGAALRAVMKHILADYWVVGRTLAGFDARPIYAEAMLGHEHIARPSDRGWKF